MNCEWIPIPNAPLEVRYTGPKWLAWLLCLHFGDGSANLGKRLQAPIVKLLCKLFGRLEYREEVKLSPVDEIKAEYERREFDLRTQHEQQTADLYREYSVRLENLCKQRAVELAEVEETDDTHQQAAN